MDRRVTFVALGFVILFPDSLAAAGRSKIKQLRPSWKGSTGLFNLAAPETLRTGEFSLGFHYSRFHGGAGQARITRFPVSFTFGIRDYLESFLSWEARKWFHTNPMGVLPQTRVAGGISSPPNGSALANLPSRADSGDLWAGLKLNLWSPNQGHPVGLALQPKIRISTSTAPPSAFPELTPEGLGVGLDVLFSRQIATSVDLTINGGYLYSGDRLGSIPGHRFDYGVGLDFPLGGQTLFLAELVGARFDESGFESPVELHLGMRLLSRRWFQLSAGYSLNLNRTVPDRIGVPGPGRHGWTAQLVLQKKINRPPVIRCRPDRQTVKSGESGRIQVYAMDPDDDILSIAWMASGGAVSLEDDSAQFDSRGLDAGVYTVSAELSDSENTSTCTVEIRVGREARSGQ